MKKHHAKIAVSVNALVVLVLRKTRPDLLDVTDLIIVAVGIVGTVGKPSVFGDVFPSSVWESAFCADFHGCGDFYNASPKAFVFAKRGCDAQTESLERGEALPLPAG